MAEKEIIQKIQKMFISGHTEFDINIFCKISEYKTNTACRLVKAWKKYRSMQINKEDFEVSLRNYLLVFNTEVEIPEYFLSESNKSGLALNYNTGKIYANYNLPNYINSRFVQKAFGGEKTEDTSSDKYILTVNPFINKLTGFNSFKSIEQKLSVMGALKVPGGYTCLVSMSTGGGKSLITQTISYQNKNSLTLVIVPTISLMLDQQRNARSIIKPENDNEIMCYYSGCDIEQVINSLRNRNTRMLFIAPEAIIKNKNLQAEIISANRSNYLQNIIVDEAHIIIEWGSSFRVDFQCFDAFRKRLLSENHRLRTYLLSATYSKATVDSLKMFYSENGKWIELRFDTLRRELRFDIIKCISYTNKHNRLTELVFKLPHPMIIYVNTPDDAETVQKEFCEAGLKNTRIFTGRTLTNERRRLIDEWTSNEFDIMIATCAFGVGMDKSDVRTVLHLYVPSGPNQYYQECGRGGRDGRPCLSVMLFTDADISAAVSLTQKVLTLKKLTGRWFSMIESEKSNKSDPGRILIDTSVKPDYNETDFFFTEASNADINWNVYVILLLRRAGLLTINDVEYEDGKYVFTVKINDVNIMYKSDCERIFDKIREDESNRIYGEISALTNKLKNLGRSCFSSMFNDVYKLTDEYCAGCNSHNDIISDVSDKLPLKKPVVYPTSEMSEKLKDFFYNSLEMIVISKEKYADIIKKFIQNGADVIVMLKNNDCSEELQMPETNNSKLQIMGVNEFLELNAENNNFYLSGCIVFLLGDDSSLAGKIINTSVNREYHRVYIVNRDFFVPERGKNISEIINGSCKYDYIIEKELE